MVRVSKFIDARSPDKAGEVPVKIIVRFDRNVRKTIDTGVRVELRHWDEKKLRVKQSHQNSIMLNVIIDEQFEELQRFVSMKMIDNKGACLADLESYLQNKTDCFVDFFEAEAFKKNIRVSSMVKYKQTLSYLKRFRYPLLPSQITKSFPDEFGAFLTNSGLGANSRRFHLKQTHTIMTRFVRMINGKSEFKGKVLHDPFDGFSIGRIKGTRTALTPEEVKRIEAYSFPTEHLQKIADVFLMMCYTGMRISDYRRYCSVDNVSDGILRYKPFKTDETSGVVVELPINTLFGGKAAALFEKYNGHPPMFADPVVNRSLKIVQGFVGIKQKLTAHVARHTFLTQIAMKTGNVFLTMQLGGLVKIETAQQYIHLAKTIRDVEGLNRIEW